MIRNVRHILGLLLLCILLLPARAEAAVSSVEDLAGLLNAEQLQSARQQVLEAIDPLYGVYNDMRDTLSDWYEYWTEDTEEMDQLFGITW